jgi:hypothetical protein
LTERQKAENDLKKFLAEREELPYEQGSVDVKDYVKGWLDQFDAYRKQPDSTPAQMSSTAYKRGAIERGKQTSVPLWQPTPFLWEWLFTIAFCFARLHAQQTGKPEILILPLSLCQLLNGKIRV